MRPLIVLLAFPLSLSLAACGKSAPTSAPAPSPQEADPPPRADKPPGPPELVEVKVDPAPTDCVASPPEGGLLDRTSSTYKKIEHSSSGQSIAEKAWLRSRDVVVEARVGGCAHFGSSYTVIMASATPVADKAAHFAAALEIIEGLALRSGAPDHRKEIGEEIRAATPEKLEICHLPRGEIDSVLCGVSDAEGKPGHVSISLAYDVAL